MQRILGGIIGPFLYASPPVFFSWCTGFLSRGKVKPGIFAPFRSIEGRLTMPSRRSCTRSGSYIIYASTSLVYLRIGLTANLPICVSLDMSVGHYRASFCSNRVSHVRGCLSIWLFVCLTFEHGLRDPSGCRCLVETHGGRGVRESHGSPAPRSRRDGPLF